MRRQSHLRSKSWLARKRAARLGSPRHVGDVIVFQRGQFGASAVYGHVAIVEQINADGSIVTSECGASLNGKTVSRTFSADQASQLQFIHY